MKTLLLTLFLLTSLAFADTGTPGGMYQIDQVHSKIVCFEKSVSINGHIDLSENFSESKLTVESNEVTFESTEFSGDIESFEVKGLLTHQGVTTPITLTGRYFGMINNEFGKKAAFNFYNKDLNLKVFASKPSDTTAALFREVQEIVE